MFSMFEHFSAKDSATKSGEGLKLSRGENELRKCLGSDTKESLVKSYACAWQRDILVQGHLNITPNYLCFYSNILGWETKTFIMCKDVISIEKHTTAIVFPTAITVTTENEKYTFASFMHRNRAHQVLTRVWEDALHDHPLSTEELIQVLNDMKKNKKQKKDKGSPSLLRRSPVLRSHTSDSYLADSSDLDNSQRLLTNGENSSPLHQQGLISSPHTSLSLPLDSFRNSLAVSRSSSQTTSTDATDGGEMSLGTERTLVYQATESASGSSDLDAEYLRKKPKRTPSPVQELNGTESSETETETGEEGTEKTQSVTRTEKKRETVKETCHEKSERLREGFLKIPSFLAQKLYSLWVHYCTPSNFINFLIVISILLLLVSTLSMICKLSHMEPTLKPLLPWQPWCRVCGSGDDCDSNAASQSHAVPIGTSNTDEHISLLTKAAFDKLVAEQDSASSRHSPSTLPTENSRTQQ